MNPYTVLGVAPDATTAQIKKEYRRLSKIYHPDNTETGDEKSFRQINEAWKVLSDPDRRKRYDETGDVEEKVDAREAFIKMGTVQALGVMLSSFIESAWEMHEVDAIELMRKEMVSKRRILEANEQKTGKTLKKSHQMMDRMKIKADDGENPIGGILKKICDDNKRKHDDSEDHLEIHRRMTLFLDAYNYDFDAAAAAAEQEKLRSPTMKLSFFTEPPRSGRRY